MSIVTVVAKVVTKGDSVDAVKAELLKLVTETRKEQGCIEYRMHQDNADPRVFIFYENWESMASLERHMNAPHFKSYVAAVGAVIAEKVVHQMTEIG